MNAFELFGFSPALDIDEALLAERFERLRAQFHPDRFSLASGLERRLAIQRAADINDAHAILADPIKRASHLLELLGAPLDEAATLQDSAFLMQQMELREALDAAQDEVTHNRLRAKAQGLWDAAWSALGRAIEGGDLSEARRLILRLQFLARFLEQLPR
ncbi:MAG: Fe-S protein assembly co-chaperone HscB [Halothiobacillaceae bacterium]